MTDIKDSKLCKDLKVLKLCKDLNLPIDPKEFETSECYTVVEEYLSTYAASTAEDYIWRLCRYLKPHNLTIYDRYDWLLEMYKKKYSNK